MTDRMDAVPTRRVVVLLDASQRGLDALEAAAGLAAYCSAPLLAVFVREEARLRSAGYSFSMEISALTGRSRRIDRLHMQSRLSGEEEWLRTRLRQAAGDSGLAYSLQVRQGNVVDEVAKMLTAGDIVVMGRCSRPAVMAGRPGSTCRTLLDSVEVPILFWERPMLRRDAILIRDERTTGGECGPDSVWSLQQVIDWFQSSGADGAVRRVAPAVLDHGMAGLRGRAGALLVLSLASRGKCRSRVLQALESSALPVLFWPV